mgnify:CR=1 FL=1
MLFAEPGQSTFHVREQFGRPQRAIVPNEGICGELMTDETSAKEGVWVDFYGGSRLRIASTHSPSYKSKLTKLARANRLILDDSNPENYEAVQKLSLIHISEPKRPY